MKMLWTLPLCLTAIALAACQADRGPRTETVSSDASHPAQAAATRVASAGDLPEERKVGKRAREVARATFDGIWPLQTETAVITCAPVENSTRLQLATAIVGRTEFALNGTAKSRGYPAIEPVWKDNPAIQGSKLNIGDLLTAALALCDSQ